jgi:hypothetical protein
MNRRTLALFGVSVLVAGVLACSSANPATPVVPTPTGANAAPDGSTLKVDPPTPRSPTNDLKLNSPVVTLTARGSTLQFQSATPVTLQYRFQVFNGAGVMVENVLTSATSYQVAATLVPNARHTWRVRAESLGEPGPFSSTASFVTEDPALINDPLTNGTTVGARIGGNFIAGQGWQSNSLTDGIDYDVPSGCISCRLVFDATNFGGQEGFPYAKDLKWVSMGDPGAFGSFGAFRDHPWKMHLVQRADYASGMEIIWRNGGTDPNGFDCSGFTQYVFSRYGLSLPREVREQFRVGQPIKAEELAPGDILFFTTTDPGPSHVAIAVGGDQFVHAPSSTGVVRVEHLSSSYWSPRFLGARRITN